MVDEFTDPSAPRHREHHVRTPTGELGHEEKLRRQQGHLRMVTGALVLVLLMLAYSAAFDLDSAAEWIVLGAICFLAVGVMVAVHGGRRA